MNGWKTVALALTVVCAAQAVWLGIRVARAADAPAPVPGAQAASPTGAAPAAAAAKPRLKCHVFLVDVADPTTTETEDRTTEIGQWVGEQEDAGWLLYGVDFEVGQKSTGYPQGYEQVCMYPA